MSCTCPGRLEVSRGIVEAKHVTSECHDEIRGTDSNGDPVDPNAFGSNDAEKLLKERDVQNIKILFCKIKKSLTTACGKALLPKLADFHGRPPNTGDHLWAFLETCGVFTGELISCAIG